VDIPLPHPFIVRIFYNHYNFLKALTEPIDVYYDWVDEVEEENEENEEYE
jgi:hypothetical protein